MDKDPKLYEKILDIFLELRDTRERFKTYSATDIKQLIKTKLKSKREPLDLQHLYRLELMISELRNAFTLEKEKLELEKITAPI
jgi:hypothetical protein